jgi:uncharacterized membrane protein
MSFNSNDDMNEIDVWINNPSVLLNKNTALEFWPTQKMCYERKINAMTRLIIILTILGFILTRSINILLIGFITLVVIYFFYNQSWYKYNLKNNKEGFSSTSDNGYDPVVSINKPGSKHSDKKKQNKKYDDSDSDTVVSLNKFVDEEYKTGTKYNPLSNVLLTEIMDNPDRLSAPPSFNLDTSDDIRKNVKKMVQMLNPTIKCSSKQLFSNLGDNFYLDQSIRQFVPTSNTKVTNDQGAFAQYLYSDMKYSGKDNTIYGAIARTQDNIRYTNP